jgi:hypothetical protein
MQVPPEPVSLQQPAVPGSWDNGGTAEAGCTPPTAKPDAKIAIRVNERTTRVPRMLAYLLSTWIRGQPLPANAPGARCELTLAMRR